MSGLVFSVGVDLAGLCFVVFGRGVFSLGAFGLLLSGQALTLRAGRPLLCFELLRSCPSAFEILRSRLGTGGPVRYPSTTRP